MLKSTHEKTRYLSTPYRADIASGCSNTDETRKDKKTQWQPTVEPTRQLVADVFNTTKMFATTTVRTLTLRASLTI